MAAGLKGVGWRGVDLMGVDCWAVGLHRRKR